MTKDELKQRVMDAVIKELDEKMSAKWAPKKKVEPKKEPEADEEPMGIEELDDEDEV